MRMGQKHTLAKGVQMAVLCLLISTTTKGGELANTLAQPFKHVVIDANPPREPHCKSIGDIDGDGFIDVLAASSTNNTEGLFWYHYPTWEKHNIHTGSFTTDMQVGDVDGDGDLDAIIPKGQYKGVSVWWYENPRPTGDAAQGPWKERYIGDAGGHDVEVADFDGNGKLDVVTREGNATIFFQNGPDSWTKFVVSARQGEGTAVGDIDGDGDLDIAIGGYWLENPLPAASPTSTPWQEHLVNANWPTLVSAHIADINHDGKNEILYAPSESAHGRLCWYESITPRTGPWTEHTIDNDVSYYHTFKTADMDRNGTLDIVTAEMHQSEFPHRVSIYFNDHRDAVSWTKQIVATSGSHNIRVGDIGNDGDMDIVGANWSAVADGGSAIEMWENTSSGSPSSRLPLDKWQRHVVDANRPWRAIFVTAGDIDGDWKPDIITGAWWYKNPGTAGGTWTRQAFGSPLNNMAAVYDFDNNGTLDVLGTEGVGADANSTFVWARNDGAGRFTILNNIQQADGTFLQGTAVARFSAGSPVEVALSWHDSPQGTQTLTVPSNPSSNTWSWRSISPFSQNEQLSAGDIDQDGDQDLLMGTAWLRNDGSTWNPLTLNGTTTDVDRSRLADMNQDGRVDAVVGFETSALPGKLAWYEHPADSSAAWTEHIITTDIIGAMSVDVADFDRDGDLDVVVGEHNLAHPTAARLFIFENSDGKGETWVPHLVYTGDEHHDGAQAVDIDGDGDLDIVSIGWTHGNVLLYENLALNPGSGGTPRITSEPRNSGVVVGGKSIFALEATGDQFLSYQWRKNGVNIPGATTAQYTTDPVSFTDHGATFDCVVTGSAGSVISRQVHLLVASSVHRTSTSLQAAYMFNEMAGNVVRDVSGVGEPLDLQITDPSGVQWGPQGLTVTRATLIASAAPATKISDALRQTHEITVEAWIHPAPLLQIGPARIITISQDWNNRNFTMGQGHPQGSPSVIDIRQRTTETTMNGTPSITTPDGTFRTELTHVVFTRKADGTGQAYINGWPEAGGIISGDFSNWDSTYHLGLANEFTMDRPWLGEYRLVTFYNRALTAQEVVNNYAAAPWPVVTGIGQDDERKQGLPESFGLEQNYPNPFNPVTRIKYSVGGTKDAGRGAGEAGGEGRGSGVSVKLVVYDLLGREVAVLVNEPKAPGTYEVSFSAKGGSASGGDAHGLSSGVYYYRLTAGSFVETKAMVLLK